MAAHVGRLEAPVLLGVGKALNLADHLMMTNLGGAPVNARDDLDAPAFRNLGGKSRALQGSC